ncbi:hypothetical protein LH435_01300 [Laribacter hongkongensis]|uniref:hypothetical protein n=1 Tax=Laribacter hongkongensis TaxID=168471 RepID=UPI001EFE16F7|nr:hypothetical protein [Laribacter hongkongensis]MCG8994253.1 hypothetical protein [Laribacter hongkongensis]MCG9009050.1 hypothetical protein [Laribacter hongkongensis]MCG9021459.1 hypothetical protein [Laribacter hongkongensis]MCG9046511.1 hypothetical protein [Laribacter hongkongensis]MCG9072665.1 hypothetical protein [Laribacter hongkongensis]
MFMKSLWLVALFTTLLHGAEARAQTAVAERITGDAVNTNDQSKGIVLLAVRWDRRWNCARFENAQLRVIAFDKLPAAKTDDAAPDIVLDDAPLVMTKPVFDNYAFRVEPGEYGLSRLEIKVAKSRSDVGVFKVPRSKFLDDGRSLGGTFTVSTGEVVYLGHFYLDCYQQPRLWRFYPEGRDGFNEYLASLKKVYPALDMEKVIFRLFQTKEFGQNYKLP